jgi:hypothetical protein
LRYYLAPDARSEPWTPEEDELLLEKFNEMGRRWTKMMRLFGGRSSTDIMSRWVSHLQFDTVHDGTKFIWKDGDANDASSRRHREEFAKPDPRQEALEIVEDEIVKEIPEPPRTVSTPEPEQVGLDLSTGRRRFTPVEDAVIIRARQSNPPELWCDIAKCLPGRTIEQCRRRWRYYLAPEVRSEPWTPEEDELLLQKVNAMGRRWSAMKPFFNGRSIVDIKDRWNHHVESKTIHDGTKFVWKDGDTDWPFDVRNEEVHPNPCPRKAALAILEEKTGQEIHEELHRAFGPVPEQILDRGTITNRPFTLEEDAVPIQARQSTLEILAAGIPKEAREVLEDEIVKETRPESWTPKEDELLIAKVNELGRQWAAMTPFFDGRNVADLRERWYKHLRLEKPHDRTRIAMEPGSKGFRIRKLPSWPGTKSGYYPQGSIEGLSSTTQEYFFDGTFVHSTE